MKFIKTFFLFPLARRFIDNLSLEKVFIFFETNIFTQS